MTTGERPPVSLEGYEQLLGDVRQLLATARDRVYQAIDNLRVQAYWQVGERIVSEELRQGSRAHYGERILVWLGADLGFGRSNTYRMLRFYRAYSVVTALDQCLSWTHYTILIDVADPGARRFYGASAVREAWSVRELRAQIRDDRYARSLATPSNATISPRYDRAIGERQTTALASAPAGWHNTMCTYGASMRAAIGDDRLATISMGAYSGDGRRVSPPGVIASCAISRRPGSIMESVATRNTDSRFYRGWGGYGG